MPVCQIFALRHSPFLETNSKLRKRSGCVPQGRLRSMHISPLDQQVIAIDGKLAQSKPHQSWLSVRTSARNEKWQGMEICNLPQHAQSCLLSSPRSAQSAGLVPRIQQAQLRLVVRSSSRTIARVGTHGCSLREMSFLIFLQAC